jgi:hypothetical protein
LAGVRGGKDGASSYYSYTGWPPTKQTANLPFRLVGCQDEALQIGWLVQLGRFGWLFGWIAKNTTADVSINLINSTTCLKSNISPRTQPFGDLNSRGCCPRRVDEVGVRDNESEWWFSRNTSRGVAIVFINLRSYEVLRSEPNRRDLRAKSTPLVRLVYRVFKPPKQPLYQILQ